jgi:hypothetical protein
MIFGLRNSKRKKPNLNPKTQKYFVEKEITNSGTIFVDLIWKYKSPPYDYYCNFIISFGNKLFPMLTSDGLHALYAMPDRIL